MTSFDSLDFFQLLSLGDYIKVGLIGYLFNTSQGINFWFYCNRVKKKN